MKKLKCWKESKTHKDSWEKGEYPIKERISISPLWNIKNNKVTKYHIIKDKNPDKQATWVDRLAVKKTKSQSITFANKYMKKHDRC